MATIEELLASLGLEKFAPKFKEEDIDLSAAKALSDDELKQLGLTIGARKKLMLALAGGGGGAGSATPVIPETTAAVVPLTNVFSLGRYTDGVFLFSGASSSRLDR